jgi:hypothetical protein
MTCNRADPARSKSSTLLYRQFSALPISMLPAKKLRLGSVSGAFISCIAKSSTWVNWPDNLPAVILQRSAPVLVLRLRLRVHQLDAPWHGLCGHSL